MTGCASAFASSAVLAVLCRAAEALLRAREWIRRRAALSSLFANDAIGLASIAVALSATANTDSGCASALRPLARARSPRSPLTSTKRWIDWVLIRLRDGCLFPCSPASVPRPRVPEPKEAAGIRLGARLRHVCRVYRQGNEHGITHQIRQITHFESKNRN